MNPSTNEAVIKPFQPITSGQSFQLVVWKDLGSGDEGAPFVAFADAMGAGYTNFTAHVDGVFHQAEVELSASLIPDNFSPVVSFSISDIKAIPAVNAIKPIVRGGDGGTKITVGLLATR